MLDTLQALEEHLTLARSLKECKQALVLFLRRFAITTFSFTYYTYHPLSANKLKYDCCSDNFISWHQHYLEEQYNDIDSTLSFVYKNHLPIYWDLKQQLLKAQNERERQMRLDSMAFGAETGLSIPVHGPFNNFAILLLVQMKGDDIDLNTSALHYVMSQAAHLFYHYLQSHLLDETPEEASFNLTQRELQCLSLLARQCTVKEMAQQMEVTERTIHFHIQKLNKKLGTKNKYQSLNKALALKLIRV